MKIIYSIEDVKIDQFDIEFNAVTKLRDESFSKKYKIHPSKLVELIRAEIALNTEVISDTPEIIHLIELVRQQVTATKRINDHIDRFMNEGLN